MNELAMQNEINELRSMVKELQKAKPSHGHEDKAYTGLCHRVDELEKAVKALQGAHPSAAKEDKQQFKHR